MPDKKSNDDIIEAYNKQILECQKLIDDINNMSVFELENSAQSEYKALKSKYEEGLESNSMHLGIPNYYQHDYQKMLEDLRLLSPQEWKGISIRKMEVKMVLNQSFQNACKWYPCDDTSAEVISITSHPKCNF